MKVYSDHTYIKREMIYFTLFSLAIQRFKHMFSYSFRGEREYDLALHINL